MDSDLNSNEGRLATFSHWPASPKPSAQMLARCGFFFSGNADFVTCVGCNIRLGQWEPYEDPNHRHAKFSPTCVFVNNIQKDVLNLSSGDEQRQSNILVPGWRCVRAPQSDIPLAVAQASFSNMSIADMPESLSYHSQESCASKDYDNYKPINATSDTNIGEGEPSMPVCESVPLHVAISSTGSVFSNHSSIKSEQSDDTSFKNADISVANVTLDRPCVASTNETMASCRAEDVTVWHGRLHGENHLRGERNRLLTFRTWPSSAPVLPEELAEAGFFYLEVGDFVRCIFCGGTLKNWERGDSAKIEHKKFYPGCPFLQNLNVGNVPIISNSQHGLHDRGSNSSARTHQGSQQLVGLENIHPGLNQFSVRKSTYSSAILLPTGQTADALAEAGFYHIGPGDTVQCFNCHGALDQWTPSDDPWTEHARWYPSCSFVRQNKGIQFVQDVQKRFRSQHNAGANQIRIIKRTTRTVAPTGGDGSTRAIGSGDELKQENKPSMSDDVIAQPASDAMLCKVCMEEPLDTVFQPCNHVACCQHCTPGLSVCPICRSPILSTMKIFIT